MNFLQGTPADKVRVGDHIPLKATEQCAEVDKVHTETPARGPTVVQIGAVISGDRETGTYSTIGFDCNPETRLLVYKPENCVVCNSSPKKIDPQSTVF